MANKVLERLAVERSHTNELIDELLAQCEADERLPSDSEREQVARYRSRLEELEPQIVEQIELEEIRSQSRDAHAVLNRSVAASNGDRPAPARPGPGFGYRSAGQFIVDYLKSRGGMRDAHGQVANSDPGALERMAPWIERVVADQITTDTPGLLPEAIVGDVLAQKAQTQPFMMSIGGAKPMGGIPGSQFKRPKITQHTDVAEQTTQKSQLQSRKMVVGSMPFTKRTFGGVVDISRQDIDWTVPSAWDILLADLAAVYGEEVDDAAAADFADDADSVNTTPVAVGTNTLANWATALYTAAATVYAASTPRRLPDRIWMSLDTWAQYGPLVDVAIATAGAQIAELMSSQGAGGFAGNMFALPRYVVPGFAADTCIVGHSGDYEVYEEVVGVLSAVEPSLFGVQVAYGGYVAYNAVTPEGLIKLTPPA